MTKAVVAPPSFNKGVVAMGYYEYTYLLVLLVIIIIVIKK